MYDPQRAVFSELFRTRARYSGVSLGQQLASRFWQVVFHRSSPWRCQRPFATWRVALYVMFMSVVTLAAILPRRPTRAA